ncbi:MAG: endonuclease III [Candidatus Lokiarchaeota archaeon]|nr:endonuclease III [Candidatus Lokiarchaeota archaeon]
MDYEDLLNKIESSLKGNTPLDELSKIEYNPFKILISTILSARTRDENTRKVTKKLFGRYTKPIQIANANIEELEKLVYETGFYKVKAARIKEVSKIIQEKHGGQVPSELKELLELPGVGRKTANCVLAYAFKTPAIACDTHVHRISNRIGLVKTKYPEETEEELSKIIPKKLWIRINSILVKFGQQICQPNNPKHNICPIEDICSKDFSMENARKKKRK